MRHTLCTPRRRQSHNKTLVLVVAAGLFALAAPVAMAQVNQVTGGIGGLNNGTLQNGDGSNHAQITLIDEQLRLIKQARDLAGAVLPDATVVTPGQTVYFVLYVDNTTAFPALDIRLTDTLNEAEFTYVAHRLSTRRSPVGPATLPSGPEPGTLSPTPWVRRMTSPPQWTPAGPQTSTT